MIKLYPCLLFLVVTASSSFGQVNQQQKQQMEQMKQQAQYYKNFYRSADSLNKLGRLYSADSDIVRKAKLLDQEHPSKYFLIVAELMKDSTFNDAAFIYYVGGLRYRYYNSVNPDYQASGDGALLTSFEYEFGETINMYLKTNIDNFVSVLKASGDYFANNDYAFAPKAKNPARYDTLAIKYPILIKDLETNKEKYRKQWDEERAQFMKSIDEYFSH